LDEEKILGVVQEVLAARRAEGEDLFAAEITYVENDSPRSDLYRIAAHALTKRFLAGGEFQHIA
jgi:hypothetical protein